MQAVTNGNDSKTKEFDWQLSELAEIFVNPGIKKGKQRPDLKRDSEAGMRKLGAAIISTNSSLDRKRLLHLLRSHID